MILKNAAVDGAITDITIEAGKITQVGRVPEPGVDLKGKTVIPGCIDIHAHGCAGFDTMDGQFSEMCAFLAEHGTTSWLPTTMTQPIEAVERVLQADTTCPGTQILGFHMEGPYISKQYKGAHNEQYIKGLDLEEFRQLENVRIVTLAPELDGAVDFIKNCGALVSVGHTAADYDITVRAIEAGASCLTHTCNAMPPLHHREPAVIGAAIDKGLYAEVICDGIHIHKAMITALYRIFGEQRLIFISDSMRATGLPDGAYEFGGMRVNVKDAVARTESGAIAGSTATLWQCVKKAVEFGIPFQSAVRMATQTPAEYLGIPKGRIAAGYDADLLVLDGMEIEAVMIAGAFFKDAD